jgi:hypothetical protein
MWRFMSQVIPPLGGVALFFLCVSGIAGIFYWREIRENRRAVSAGKEETWYGKWSKVTPNHRYYGPVIGAVFVASLAGLIVPPVYKHYHPLPTFDVALNADVHLHNLYPPNDDAVVRLGTVVTLVCQPDVYGGIGHYGAMYGDNYFEVESTQLELVPGEKLATCNTPGFPQPRTDKNTKYYVQQ